VVTPNGKAVSSTDLVVLPLPERAGNPIRLDHAAALYS
jgi:hypothetical protein